MVKNDSAEVRTDPIKKRKGKGLKPWHDCSRSRIPLKNIFKKPGSRDAKRWIEKM